MHRSGTSLLGGILERLGVELPGETIVGDRHNPEGYFEWEAVVALQERLLIDLQRWWPAHEGTLPLPLDWLNHPATRTVYAELRSLLSVVIDNQTGLWAVKDPRSSRLLPLWIQLCRDLEIPLFPILAVRHPAEVVTSLVRRDGVLAGMDSLRAQKLWYVQLEVVHVARIHLCICLSLILIVSLNLLSSNLHLLWHPFHICFPQMINSIRLFSLLTIDIVEVFFPNKKSTLNPVCVVCIVDFCVIRCPHAGLPLVPTLEEKYPLIF